MANLQIRNLIHQLETAPGHEGPLDVLGLSEGAGKRFFVDSVTGQGSLAAGKRAANPLSTIALALEKVTANKGDTILLLPGHAQTITAAGGIDISKAGTRVIGMGTGSLKPTITLGTATTATFLVSANNVLIKGIRFVGNIDSLVKFLDVNADHCTIEDCDFVTSSTLEATSFINLRTTKDFLTVRRCRFLQPTDPVGANGGADTGAIYCVDSENVIVEDCIFDGFFETACLHNRTTKMKYLAWRRNTVNQQLTDAARIILPAGAGVGISLQPDTDFVPGLGYPCNRATATPPATATTAYFTIAGGWVHLTKLMGEVTTVIQTQACNFNFQANPTAAGTSLDICAVLDISAKAVASVFSITGTLANAMLNGVAAVAQTTPLLLPPGTIDAVASATNSGSIKWQVWWTPVDISLGVPNVTPA